MRRIRVLRSLHFFPILGVFLIGCPAMTPGTGARSGAGSLSPSHEAGGVFSAASATKESEGGGSAPDATFADASKPYPGGAVAPNPDSTEPSQYVVSGTATPVCRQEWPGQSHVEMSLIHFLVKGTVLESVDSPDSPNVLKPLTSCAGRIVRVVKGKIQSNLSPLECTDYAVDADCGFEGALVVRKSEGTEGPVFEELLYFISRHAMAPNSSPCEKEILWKADSDFVDAAGFNSAFAKAPTVDLPACPSRK